jgi:hypothetical protein
MNASGSSRHGFASRPAIGGCYGDRRVGLSRLHRTAWRLAVYASPWPLRDPGSKLASGRWLSFTGRIGYLRGCDENTLQKLPSASGTIHAGDTTGPRNCRLPYSDYALLVRSMCVRETDDTVYPSVLLRARRMSTAGRAAQPSRTTPGQLKHLHHRSPEVVFLLNSTRTSTCGRASAILFRPRPMIEDITSVVAIHRSGCHPCSMSCLRLNPPRRAIYAGGTIGLRKTVRPVGLDRVLVGPHHPSAG